MDIPDDKLVIEMDFPGTTPEDLFAYWIEPALLTRWWPEEASVEPKLGGVYHFSWPRMGWSLRGHYRLFDPPTKLGFTWQWDHEPHTPTRNVFVDFEPLAGGGTRLTLTHSTYNSTEADQKERQGHLEGWTHFLGKLRVVTG